MAWIESHDTLAHHPKKDLLVEALFGGSVVPDDVADSAAIGILHRLWWWALDYAEDGDLSDFTDRQVARGCGWRGDPAALMSALTESGFVDEDRHIHDWHEYTGRLVVRREANRRRSKTVYKQSARRLRADYAQTTEPPNTTNQTQPNQPTPNGVGTYVASDADGFEDFWSAYPPNRRTDKAKAKRAWHARLKSGTPPGDMIAAASHYAEHTRQAGTEPRFIKHPATFIGPDRPFEEWVGGIPEAYRANGSRDLSADDLFAMAAMAQADDVPDSDCEVIPDG